MIKSKFTLLLPERVLSKIILPLCLMLTVACGGSKDSAPVPPSAYSEKISNITVSDSLVFFAVEVADGRFELFNVDPVTGVRSGISDTFSANNSLRPLSITADGSRIAYRADKDNDGIDELYSNIVDGSNEVLISNILETNSGDHFNWQWLPNASRIIFRSDPDNDGIFEIQSMLPDGTDLQVISGNLSVTCDQQICWQIASNSSFVTFKTESLNQTSQIAQNLYAVAPDANGLIQLNQTINAESRIHDWRFAPDSSRVAYVSQNIGEARELYTVLTDASERNLLNNQSTSLGVLSFVWAPDSSRIAYTDDNRLPGQASLFTVLPDASDRIHMIDTFEVSNPQLIDWQWSPDSSRIAFMADQEVQGVFELFTVQNDGQWHRRMNPPLPQNGVVQNEWQWSPASDFIAFYAEINSTKNYNELYSAAADASQLNQVNLPFSSSASLRATKQHWTFKGSHIIYSVIGNDGEIDVIYSVLSNGTSVRQMNDGLEEGQIIQDNYLISPDSNHLIYQVNSADGMISSLHLSTINITNRVNLVTLGVVSQAHWLNDSSRIIYVVKTNDEVAQQMYSVLPDGTGKVKLY